jgi:hypothetical protein
MKMPFGKYRGTEIEDIPSDYLKWLRTIDLHGHLKRAVEDEWRVREPDEDEDEDEDEAPATPPMNLDGEDRALLDELMRAGYRTLARKYHPDLATGHAETMVRLNRLMDRLKDLRGDQ